MHCHLVVPDLFWPRTDEPGVYEGLRLPALELMLARGRRSISPVGGYAGWLAAAFALGGEHPALAPYRLLGDGVEPGEAHWLCADPVHLQAGINHVSLTDTALLDLTAEEAASLVGALNRHFREDALELIAPCPSRWYVRTRGENLVTTPLEAAQGVVMEAVLPRGDGGGRWRRLLTEAQMIMHEHPVNQVRAERGMPAVNGIWVWGGGAARPLTPRHGERWFAEDAIARGLARAAGAFAAGLPAALHSDCVPGDGIGWYALGCAMDSARRSDVPGWRDALAWLERGWFAPVSEMLRRGRIGMITVHAISPSATLSVEVTRTDLRHLWRRPRVLPSYVGSAPS